MTYVTKMTPEERAQAIIDALMDDTIYDFVATSAMIMTKAELGRLFLELYYATWNNTDEYDWKSIREDTAIELKQFWLED